MNNTLIFEIAENFQHSPSFQPVSIGKNWKKWLFWSQESTVRIWVQVTDSPCNVSKFLIVIKKTDWLQFFHFFAASDPQTQNSDSCSIIDWNLPWIKFIDSEMRFKCLNNERKWNRITFSSSLLKKNRQKIDNKTTYLFLIFRNA